MRREILLLATAAMLSSLAEYLYAPIYAIYVEKLGGHSLEAGLTWAIYTGVIGIVAFISGRFVDRLKRHVWILYTGFFLAGLISLLFPLAKNVLHLAILQFLLGLVWAITNPVWDVYYSFFMDRREAASAWSLYEGGSRLARALGSAVGGFIVVFLGFKGIFLFAGVLNMIASALIFLYRRELSIVY